MWHSTRRIIRSLFPFKAACCQLHIAALMAEYLKLRKVHSWGAEAFDQISVNISKDERNLKLDAGEICMSALLYRVPVSMCYAFIVSYVDMS